MKEQPFSKEEITKALANVFNRIEQTITELPEGVFTQKPNQKWSIAEQFTHLIKSCYPVSAALKLEKEQLLSFGKPSGPSRTYAEIKEFYYDKLAEGLKAPNTFIPNIKEGTTKSSMIENWQKISHKFQDRIVYWSEEDLENYVIPHPVLGGLTVREMLLFTILHNYHHLKAIESLEKAFV